MKLDLFDEQKYQTAAATCLAFIKRQFNVSNFTIDMSFPKTFDEGFQNQTMYGNVTSDLSSYRLIDETGYVSLDGDYDYEYEGEVSGSSISSFVRYYEWTDVECLVTMIPVHNGRWSTLDVGITARQNCIKMVYDAEGHCARKYYDRDAIRVRLYIYAIGNTEYLTDECTIYHSSSGSKFFFSNKTYPGAKICKAVVPNGIGGWSVVGLAGGISNATTGRFPASFLIPEDDPQYDKDGSTAQGVYGYLLNSRTFLYDVGLAFLVLTEAGEYTLCQKMLERLELEQNSDGSFNFSFDIYIGVLFHRYVRTGSVGWLVWGICYYILKSGDYNQRWLNMLDKAGVWICGRQVTDENDDRYGLLTGGYGSYNMDDYSYNDEEITWCSTEHNCSTLQALFGLSLIFDPTDRIDYGYRAALVQTGLMNTLWNRDADRFYQGVNDPAWALDCATWAGIQSYNCINRIYAEKCESLSADVYTMTGKRIVQGTTKDRYNQRYYSNSTFDGFKPYSDRTPDYQGAPDIVWSEGTLGHVLLCMKIGQYDEAKYYMDEIVKLQTDVSNCTGGILYVNATYGELPWEFHVWESMVSSAWMYLLIKNPQCLFPTVCRTAPYCSAINLSDIPPVPPVPAPTCIDAAMYKINLETGEIDYSNRITVKIPAIDAKNRFRWSHPENDDWYVGYGCYPGDSAYYWHKFYDGESYTESMWIFNSRSSVENIYGVLGTYFLPEFINSWNQDDPLEHEYWEADKRHWEETLRAYYTILGQENRLQSSDVLRNGEGYGWTTAKVWEGEYLGLDCYLAWDPYSGNRVAVCVNGGASTTRGYFLSYNGSDMPDTAFEGTSFFVHNGSLKDGKIASNTISFSYPKYLHYISSEFYEHGKKISDDCMVYQRAFFDEVEPVENWFLALEWQGSMERLFVQV